MFSLCDSVTHSCDVDVSCFKGIFLLFLNFSEMNQLNVMNLFPSNPLRAKWMLDGVGGRRTYDVFIADSK